MKKIITSLFLLSASLNTTAYAALEPKLAIDQELFLSDKTGVIKAAALAKATAGTLVKFYKTDGAFYTGIVNLVIDNNDSFEVQGTITNAKGKANFAFKLAKGGMFIGAVVEHDTKSTYVLEFSLPHKGFVLVYTLKYNIEA